MKFYKRFPGDIDIKTGDLTLVEFGAYDRLLDFSTAITGTTFFVPTAAMLGALAEPPPDPAAATMDGVRRRLQRHRRPWASGRSAARPSGAPRRRR